MNTTTAPQIAGNQEETASSMAAWLSVRHLAAKLLQSYPRVPALVVVVSGIAVVVSQVMDWNLVYRFVAAAALASSSFVWGFWARASHIRRFPPLSHLHRRQYAADGEHRFVDRSAVQHARRA